MSESNTKIIILYGGMILLTYYILKSWGIIQPMSLNKNQMMEWKPLSESEIQNIKNVIDKHSNIQIVRRI